MRIGNEQDQTLATRLKGRMCALPDTGKISLGILLKLNLGDTLHFDPFSLFVSEKSATGNAVVGRKESVYDTGNLNPSTSESKKLE